jgi:formylmethanofuran dehydrogenase subunit D
MEFILNTVRNVDFDQAKEFTFGSKDSLRNNLGIALLNKADIKSLNLKEDVNLAISSKYGKAVVKWKEHEKIPSGMISMPISIWSNQLTGLQEDEISYKNITVEASRTEEKVLSLDELLKSLKSGMHE